MDRSTLGILVGIASGITGTIFGIWSRVDKWQDQKRARITAEREDQDFTRRNAADMRVSISRQSGYGKLPINIVNRGRHRAELSKLVVEIGIDVWEIPQSDHIVEAGEGLYSLPFDLRPESKKQRGTYTTEEMQHLPTDGIVEMTYTDGLGVHTRRWRLIFERKGERFADWDIAIQPLEK